MNTYHGYTLLSVSVPARPMKVEWITKDGTWDCGWFNGTDYLSFDPHFDEIVKWRPFQDGQNIYSTPELLNL